MISNSDNYKSHCASLPERTSHLKMSGLDEILLRAVPCELADNGTVAGQHILEQDKPFQPLDSRFLHPLTFC